MYDAVQLARQIIKHGVEGLDAAVVEYERDMLPRAVEALEKGVWYTENLFGADAAQDFLRAIGVDSPDA